LTTVVPYQLRFQQGPITLIMVSEASDHPAGYDSRFFAVEFGLVVECDECDVAEIDALLRAHAAKEVSVVEA
jgi:hypothetical protein